MSGYLVVGRGPSRGYCGVERDSWPERMNDSDYRYVGRYDETGLAHSVEAVGLYWAVVRESWPAAELLHIRQLEDPPLEKELLPGSEWLGWDVVELGGFYSAICEESSRLAKVMDLRHNECGLLSSAEEAQRLLAIRRTLDCESMSLDRFLNLEAIEIYRVSPDLLPILWRGKP